MLTPWPPGPDDLYTSIRRSFSSISTAVSSSMSGITRTPAAEVWMRPWDSVTGTRCTRCTPPSNLRTPYGMASGFDVDGDLIVMAMDL